MAARIAPDDALETLLANRHDLWRGRVRPNAGTLPTGHPQLDRLLPGGGWPCGRIVELLPTRQGIGELRLLLPLIADRTARQQPVVLAAPPWIPQPRALQAAGVNLAWLTLLHASDQVPWAIEQCLKSGLCGAVLAWPSARIQPRDLRRLQLAAEHGPAPVFLCRRPGSCHETSPATLRLIIRPGPEVELHSAAGRAGRRVHPLQADNIVPLHAASGAGDRSTRPLRQPQTGQR